jgi:transposase
LTLEAQPKFHTLIINAYAFCLLESGFRPFLIVEDSHRCGFLIQALSRVRRPARMPRVLSQDLRERVAAAIDGGMSCRAAAARFGVSAASAIRWRQLVVQHGTPAARRQGGDRHAARIDAYATLILEGIETKDDITLVELQGLLAERSTPVGIGPLWRFFDRHRIARKKDGPRH